MDLMDPLAKVRLKFFLANQAEGRSGGANAGTHLTSRPAGILAALALMEQYSGRPMKGEEIRSLFQGLSASGLSNVMRSLNSKSLVERDQVYYRITPLGVIFLIRFANDVLGAPTPVETEFRQNTTYRDLMKSAEEVVDKVLRQRFELAMRNRRATRTDSFLAIHGPNSSDAEPMTQ
jgi:hypothetical protein